MNSEFLKLCRKRKSVRRFADRPVEREKIELCLEAARRAPSADNMQPWRFVVFDDPTRKRQMADAVFRGAYSMSRRFAAAPVIVALLIKENLLVNKVAGVVQGTQWQLVDSGIAGEHFVLAAAELGLGTCWIGWYDGRALIKHLGLRGKGYRPVALIALGYPAAGVSPNQRPRKPLSDIASWNEPPR
ncbi:nitroreductase family protein [candidate division WOR-3 bacterium]|nr:nitroreductase family protein [candidate division WOR-3 bacterium]